ncbi:PIR protein [Plasmodium vivax]|uniref:VIR protein n=1 Tax=Plasmodium vivax TaxID=5855 RepID=A0A565A5P3_PLAVI|nr:PIR protein [Plasmodium vivax]
MKRTSYNIEKIYNTYKEILEAWMLPSNFPTINECIGFKKELIEEHNNIFTNIHCSQAQHYLNNVKKINNHQYINNACKYFLYWLYFIVLQKDLEKHKILKIYQDVLTAYIEGSGNENFRKYVNIFSEETIEKFIKLTEMYDYFYKFKGNTQHGDNKCNHAKECFRLYKENIKVCEEGNDNDFCYELDNLKEIYDAYMKSNDRCTSLPKTLKSYRVYNRAAIIITPFSILLVISLSLFFLYKFTPFGSLFRKKTKNKKKIPGNLDYATPVLPHTSQSVNNYNNNRQYNISYLSSGQ